MRIAIISLLLLLLPGALLQAAPAPSSAPPASPQAFFLDEFLGGTVGALLTGPAATSLYVSFTCRDAADPDICRELFNTLIRPLIFAVGVPIGATLGIWTLGLINGVEGNLVGATIGSVLGGWGGILEASVVFYGINGFFNQAAESLAHSDAPEYLKRSLPALIELLRPSEKTIKELAFAILPTMTAAAFGTMGFNSGARLRP